MGKRKPSPKKRDKEFLSVIIQRIKGLREKKRASQERFFEDTGINIGRIERGVADFNQTTLKKICRYFDISPEEFFKGLK